MTAPATGDTVRLFAWLTSSMEPFVQQFSPTENPEGLHLEPLVEPHFHPDSYGYRPKKSALDAVATARQRCWRYDWVIDLASKGFFANLDWELVVKAVRHHVQARGSCC